ncbi:hypothetical protein K2Z83_01015 [Oscillochloris sp. ZM17-4]|uniref:golvesin C-terminal-like domain-containing protein n=1 Tax=Oscillochloris sp. ZM17-4 TaxID=2866714 RepID=UPI001C7357B2|nr:hypothetical protein [Oscillochloris sp. ZM17-4]MBX0326274.1 hypothetical protein [Oscillochloris sp. ZM17-4]
MIEGKLRHVLAVAILALMVTSAGQVGAAPSAAPSRQDTAPTYRIFATREGLVGRTTANGHTIQPRDRFVALPSWSVLSPKGTSQYAVRLTYNGRSVVVPVWDVGPWNTKDDYWSPNRRYGDLPVGRPMAHAAVFDGYNGGRDESGRVVRDPNGIDIADGTFWDDLGMSRSDYVLVTFLWLGADPGPGNAAPIDPPPATRSAPAHPAKPVEVESGATAVDNGGEGYSASGPHWDDLACGVGGGSTYTLSTSDPAKGTSAASWSPQLPSADFYELKAYVPACGPAATRSARYRISHDGVVNEVLVDQQANAGQWVSLGVFHFLGSAESQPRVDLGDVTDDSGLAVRFDAMAWAPRTDTTPPNGTVTAIARKDNGYQISWGGTDDMSGIATYDVQVRQLPKGGWTDWKQGVADIGAWFGPDEGKQFAFRVRARDWAGNQEPWPDGADMDTTQAAP